MKTALYLTFLLSGIFIFCAFGQTVEISNKYNTQIIFDEAVETRELGNDLTFSFGSENSFSRRIVNIKYFGDPGSKEETNLQVITVDGKVYDLKLTHKIEPIKSTYIIDKAESLHSLLSESMVADTGENIKSNYSAQSNNSYSQAPQVNRPIQNQPKDQRQQYISNQYNRPDYRQLQPVANNFEAKTANLYLYSDPVQSILDENSVYTNIKANVANYGRDRENFIIRKAFDLKDAEAAYYLPRSKFNKRKHNIRITLKGLHLSNDEMYISYTLKNSSNNPYSIRDFKLLIESAKGSKYRIEQPLEVQPIYVEGLSKTINSRAEMNVVVVLKKFTLNDGKVLSLKLDEENGERHLDFSIENDIINNPISVL